jgi:hypothetical protein
VHLDAESSAGLTARKMPDAVKTGEARPTPPPMRPSQNRRGDSRREVEFRPRFNSIDSQIVAARATRRNNIGQF